MSKKVICSIGGEYVGQVEVKRLGTIVLFEVKEKLPCTFDQSKETTRRAMLGDHVIPFHPRSAGKLPDHFRRLNL